MQSLINTPDLWELVVCMAGLMAGGVCIGLLLALILW